MKFLFALAIGSLPLVAIAAAPLCGDTYYLQSVKQTLLMGTDAKALTVKSVKDVSPNLTDFEVNGSVNYKLLTQFEGSCTKAIKPITFKKRTVGSTTFTDTVDNSYQVQLYDTNTRVSEFKYDQWFGFFKPAESLHFVLGNYSAHPESFVNWYVAMTYTDSMHLPDSVRANGGPQWGFSTSTYSLSGPDDSLVLEKMVIDSTIRKIVPDSNHKNYSFTVQFLKMSYGNSRPVIGIKQAKSPSHFKASQWGQIVLIQSESIKSDLSETVNLLDMLGNKITSLHPTGYAYQWNGKTAAGADASTGVYFVQVGNRVVGKFFYRH